MAKTYLGDGVYAEMVNGETMIRLTAENGARVTHEIFLELDVYQNLIIFAESGRADAS